MFENVDTSVIDGLAWAIFSLIIFMIIVTVVPILLLEKIGVPRMITHNLIGIFGLAGFALWIYGMFFLDLQKLFI
jgi:predicted permease